MEMTTDAVLRRSPATVLSGRRNRMAPARVSMGVGGFADEGHLKYYSSLVMCDDGERKVKRKEVMKRRAKLVEGLAKDMAKLKMGLVDEETMGKMIWDAAGILVEQSRDEKKEMKKMLKEMKKKQNEEEKAAAAIMNGGCCNEDDSSKKEMKKKLKEMKKKQKEEAKAAAAIMNGGCCNEDDSSSCSSESSDSECEKNEVLNMRCAIPQEPTQITAIPMAIPQIPESSGTTNQVYLECRSSSIAVVEKPMNKIEVCMGGKCKKSGSIELLQEFEKIVGSGGAVVGCKCMGKCKEGPNVRVVNQDVDGAEKELKNNPLCIGVGLDDVSNIVAGLFGEKDVGLMTA